MRGLKKFIALVMVIAIVWNLTGCASKEVSSESEPLKPAKVVEVKVDNYAQDMEISGNVKPGKLIKAAFKVPGVVDFIYVEEGDRVVEGQSLMSLQSHDYELNVTATKAQYEALEQKSASAVKSAINQAEANLNFVKTQHERVKRLYEKGAVAKKTLEEIETALVVAENKHQEALDAEGISETQLKQAKAAWDLAASKLTDTVLKSPINGTVIKTIFESGETIAPGYPAVVLGKLDELEVEIGVPDNMVKNITIGDEVDVLIYGLDLETKGTVKNIDTTADQQTRTFGVKINIDNKDLIIKPGMIAKVKIQPKNKEDMKGILLPVDSVIKYTEGAVVFVVNEESVVEERPVQTGEVIKDKIKILQGLNEGEKVVVEGQYKLKSGDKVKLEVASND
ncbi:efflux RND transporter periplasmic adaptor subunit [Clostridiisalibacter paucivorans]|uniref:efflux RND transporter periplasmic adaptor subunit n=1 Tax=Clostridiisalibacter paucivorans TaxID=408753 RepID=UPI00047B6C03|nr:efflux RND transporter periplasmic adaptor subunit [Clostridiisalibacter paucivorans]